jgi:voltage-gated potassium channel
MKAMRRYPAPPLVQAFVARKPRLSWLQALGLVAGVTALVVLVGAVLVTRTDPDRYPEFGTALWWAVTTVTTVGYGDVVPGSAAGRVVGGALMFVGIAAFACLTAVAASAIVVGEVGGQEQEIQREEREIEDVQRIILARLTEIDARLERIDRRGRLPRHPVRRRERPTARPRR